MDCPSPPRRISFAIMIHDHCPKAERLLFAVHDWGLGHATRCLVLIQALIEHGNEVTVLMAPSRGLTLLQSELGDRCSFYPYADIPKPFGRSPALFYIAMSLAMPWVWLHFKREHRLTEWLVRERGYDRVISDTRLGVWSKAVPSYCIFHSLRQIIPGRPRWLEKLVENGQRRLLSPYQKVLIPDYSDDEDGLAGDLAHEPTLDWGAGRLAYIGPLSGVRHASVDEDIDCFISLSGIEPQRSLLERQVRLALPQLSGRVVMTCGCPDRVDQKEELDNVTIYGYLDRATQAQLLNRARIVVARSGYTTLMELSELGKRALLIPTPGQREQEHLGQFHHQHGHAWLSVQRDLDLQTDLARAKETEGIPQRSTADSVEKFLAALR